MSDQTIITPDAIKSLPTPFYLLDVQAIINNLKTVQQLCDASGAKALLALKCFATWGVFDAMKPYLHGTTSSSLNEVRLGKETFGKETHAYSVAYHKNEIADVLSHADKIIFNSLNQLAAFKNQAKAANVAIGLRLNPQVSHSGFVVADPARPFSRLGEHDIDKITQVLPDISGVMIHNNCENDSFTQFCENLDAIEARFASLLHQLEWVSLGGGIHFIAPDYPVQALAKRLKAFANTYGVQVYLEPGEACVHNSAILVTTVLDTLFNGKSLAVVDASTEAHMLDLLIYQEPAKLAHINWVDMQHVPVSNPHDVHFKADDLICGKSCLAGDLFGAYQLEKPLEIGDVVGFANAAGYTMVKKNWFNGVAMPAIVIKDEAGVYHLQQTFDYQDYKRSLS